MQTVRVDLTSLTPDPGREIVARGNRINGVSLTSLPVGAAIRFKFGNNQPSSLITQTGAWDLDAADILDVTEGLSIINETALPGSVAEMTISFSKQGGSNASAAAFL
jgi:hypothetical protein